MRLMIDILHPAHVHFFRHAYFELIRRGHKILVTARDKDCAIELLNRYGIPHHRLSVSQKGLGGQLREMVSRTTKFIRLAREFRPDVLAGIMGPTIAVAGKLLRRPAYVFYDTELARMTNRFVYPLAAKVITPDCYEGKVGSHHVTYPGYHELAYLHPNRFQPDLDRVRAAGIDIESPFAVVRFVGFFATHDRGEHGLSAEQQVRVVKEIERFVPVVLSSEVDVPAEIADRLYQGPLDEIHHVLAAASLFFGDSATMAAEAALLGTPAVYVGLGELGYLKDLERHGLLFRLRENGLDHQLDKARELLSDLDATARQSNDRRRWLLKNKIDVADYLVNLFEEDFGFAPSSKTESVTAAAVE